MIVIDLGLVNRAWTVTPTLRHPFKQRALPSALLHCRAFGQAAVFTPDTQTPAITDSDGGAYKLSIQLKLFFSKMFFSLLWFFFWP